VKRNHKPQPLSHLRNDLLKTYHSSFSLGIGNKNRNIFYAVLMEKFGSRVFHHFRKLESILDRVETFPKENKEKNEKAQNTIRKITSQRSANQRQTH